MLLSQPGPCLDTNLFKGSIVPVPPGTMRNTWFPNRMAEYMTLAKLKELGDVVIERDPTYGGRQEKELAKGRKDAEREKARRIREIPSLPIELATPIESLTPAKHESSIEPMAILEPPEPIEPEELSVGVLVPYYYVQNMLTFA